MTKPLVTAPVSGSPRIGDPAPSFTANWRPDEPVIVAPPGSCGTAKDRMDAYEDGVTCIDWFFCTKELAAADFEAALLPA